MGHALGAAGQFRRGSTPQKAGRDRHLHTARDAAVLRVTLAKVAAMTRCGTVPVLKNGHVLWRWCPAIVRWPCLGALRLRVGALDADDRDADGSDVRACNWCRLSFSRGAAADPGSGILLACLRHMSQVETGGMLTGRLAVSPRHGVDTVVGVALSGGMHIRCARPDNGAKTRVGKSPRLRPRAGTSFAQGNPAKAV